MCRGTLGVSQLGQQEREDGLGIGVVVQGIPRASSSLDETGGERGQSDTNQDIDPN